MGAALLANTRDAWDPLPHSQTAQPVPATATNCSMTFLGPKKQRNAAEEQQCTPANPPMQGLHLLECTHGTGVGNPPTRPGNAKNKL